MSHNGSRMSNAQVAHPWQASLSREEVGGLIMLLRPSTDEYLLELPDSSPSGCRGLLTGVLWDGLVGQAVKEPCVAATTLSDCAYMDAATASR